MPQLPEPDIQNKFPDCVFMKLHFGEVQRQKSTSRLSVIALGLTINFSGEQEMDVPSDELHKLFMLLGFPDGKVSFGVRRGRLQFTLSGCSMPLEESASQPFEISKVIENQTEYMREASIGGTLGGKTGGIGGFKAGNKSGEKITIKVSQFKRTGSEKKPAWIFEAQGRPPILEGALKEHELGTLLLTSSPCNVVATFRVRGEDIYLTWGNIWHTKDVIRNKSAVIERALTLRYIGRQLEKSGSLSEVRWQYD